MAICDNGHWANLADVFECCDDTYLKAFEITLPAGWDGIVPAPVGGAFEAFWLGLSDAQRMALTMAQETLDAAQEWLHEKTCYRHPGIVCDYVWPCVPCRCGGGTCVPCRYAQAIDFRYVLDVPIVEIDRIVFYEEPATGNQGVPRAIDPSEWRVDDGCILVRHSLDGQPNCWPTQDRNKPPGAPGTWVIEWKLGWEPTALQKRAAAQLACAWLAECLNDRTCCDTAEKGATSISKNGVTIKLRTIAEKLEAGATENVFVDYFLDAFGCKPERYGGMFDPAEVVPDLKRVTFPTFTHPIIPVP